MDEKKPLVLDNAAFASVPYGNNVVKVKKYLSLAEQKEIARAYCENYFTPSADVGFTNRSRFEAQSILMLTILDLCTDIQMFDEDKPLFTIDMLFLNMSLWNKIIAEIGNFDEFKHNLTYIVNEVENMLALEKSIGTTIDNAYARLSSIITSVLEFDASEENLNNIRKLMAEINQSPILAGILKKEGMMSDVPESEINAPEPKVRKSRKKAK